MTVASLAIEVQTSGVKSGASDLDHLTSSSRNADKAIDALTASSKEASSGLAKMGFAVNNDTQALNMMTVRMQENNTHLRSLIALSEQTVTALNKLAAARDRDTAAAVRNRQANQNDNNPNNPLPPRVVGDREAQFRRRNLQYQLFDVGQGAAMGMNPAMIAMQQGPQIAQMYAGQGGINVALKDMAGLAMNAARGFAPIAVAALAAGVAIKGAQGALTEMNGRAISMGETISAVFGALGDEISELFGPAYDAVSEWVSYATKELGKAAIDIVQWILIAFQAVWADIKFIVGNWPDITEAALIGLGNVLGDVLDTIAKNWLAFFNVVITGINLMIAGVNQLRSAADAIKPIVPFDLTKKLIPEIPNPAADRLDIASAAHEKVVKAITSSNPVWDWIEKVMKKAGEYAGTVELPDGTNAPIPTPPPRGPDDRPGQMDWMDDLEKSTAGRVRALEAQRKGLEATGAAAESFSFQQQAINEAVAHNIELTPDLLANIKRLGDAYGTVSQAAKQAALDQDLVFEREQAYRTPEEREVASRLRGLGIPLNSPEGDYLRGTQEVTKDMERQKKVRDEAEALGIDLMTGIRNSFLEGGDDLGKVLLQSIQKAFMKASDMFIEQLAQSLVKMLFPAQGVPAGGVPGLAGAAAPVAGAAANVGAVLAGSVGSYTNAVAGGASLVGNSVAEQSWNFFKGKGLADHQVAGILGNMKAESAFKPGIKGDSGQALGLFQWNDRKNAMMSAVGPDWATDVKGQLDFAWKELTGSEGQALSALKNSKDVRGATGAFAGFERPKGFTWGNPEGAMHFDRRLAGSNEAYSSFAGKVSEASAAVDTLTTTSTAAAEGLGGVATTASKVATNLFPAAPAAPAAGGGGGIFGWLGSLFGGGGAMGPLSPQATAAINSGTAGLYHDGGIAGYGTRFRRVNMGIFDGAVRLHDGGIAGDEVPAILKRGEPVFRSMAHAREAVGNDNRTKRDGPPAFNVIVNGARGNREVMEMVTAGVQDGFSRYEESQKYGAGYKVDNDYKRWKE